MHIVSRPVQDEQTPALTFTGADFHLAGVKGAAKRGRDALRDLAAIMEVCTASDIVDPIPAEGNERLPEFLEALASAIRAKRSLN